MLLNVKYSITKPEPITWLNSKIEADGICPCWNFCVKLCNVTCCRSNEAFFWVSPACSCFVLKKVRYLTITFPCMEKKIRRITANFQKNLNDPNLNIPKNHITNSQQQKWDHLYISDSIIIIILHSINSRSKHFFSI